MLKMLRRQRPSRELHGPLGGDNGSEPVRDLMAGPTLAIDALRPAAAVRETAPQALHGEDRTCRLSGPW